MSRSIIALTVALLLPSAAFGHTKIANLCTVAGQSELTLRGQGLVVGLAGTGDPKTHAATVQAVTTYLRKSGQNASPNEQVDVSSYALVDITVTIPRHGVERGENLDCEVSAIGGATSLRGGRLVIAGLTLHGDYDERGGQIVSGYARGTVSITNLVTPTSGRILGGAVMHRTLITGNEEDPTVVRLRINSHSAGFRMAHNIQKAINDKFQLQGRIAKAHSEAMVVVQIPEPYRYDYVQFVAELMSVSIQEAGTDPRVTIDSVEGIVILTGTTSITPVAFTHRNINVEIEAPFLPVQGDTANGSPQQLNDLLEALNQLKVPTDDVIAIVRGLHEAGALQAKLIER